MNANTSESRTSAIHMRTIVIFVLLAALLMGLIRGCGLIHRTQSVADVTKAETITLKKNTGQGHISSFTITCSGEIQGTAEISLMENGKAYRTEKLSGPVNFKWGGEWYSDTADIRYEPKSVTGGNLRLEYRFKDR